MKHQSVKKKIMKAVIKIKYMALFLKCCFFLYGAAMYVYTVWLSFKINVTVYFVLKKKVQRK